MSNEIPTIIEELYPGLYPGPDPKQWPEYLRGDPVQAHGLLSFYRGLQLGVRLCTVWEGTKGSLFEGAVAAAGGD